jgi:hypothetical protein
MLDTCPQGNQASGGGRPVRGKDATTHEANLRCMRREMGRAEGA